MFGLRRRLKQALGRTPQAPAAEPAFDAAAEEVWAELQEQYALGYQTIAASVVASWEVAAAELNRAARPRFGDEAGEIVTRFSDALVPTLTPVQTAERATKGLWKEAATAGRASGRIADALTVVVAQPAGLGAAIEAEWPKTVAHLGPVLDRMAVGTEGRARLDGVGPTIRAALDGRARELARLLAAPRALEAPFLDAVEVWRHGASQDVEVALDQVRSVLVGGGA